MSLIRLEHITRFYRALETDSNHGVHTAPLAAKLARALGLPETEIEILEPAAILHDVGKLKIPPDILGKNGKLTGAERVIVQQHPLIGVEIMKAQNFSAPVARILLPIVELHHERWDGSGYPYGARENEIPIWPQIVGLADTVDTVMRNGRPYQKGKRTAEQTLKEIMREPDKFSPVLLRALRQLVEDGKLE